MEREELIGKIQQGLESMRKWGINTYRSGQQEMNRLNPHFGFRDTDNNNNLSRTKGVISLWMGNGAEDMTVQILPRGFGDSDKELKTQDLTDLQLEAVLQLVDGLCEKEVQDRKLAAMTPKLEEILPRIEFWSKRCVAAAGPEYSAFVSLGKRAFDKEKYHAIVIYENNDQIGSISLKQTEDGRMCYNERTPLGGQWSLDEPLSIRDVMTPIRDSIASITGRTVELDVTMPQKQLLDDVRKNNRKWMESGMTYDLQVQRGGTIVPEQWKLSFNHQFVSENQVSLKLTGTRTGDMNAGTYIIATGTYNPEKPEEWLMMEGKGEQTELLKALADAGKVEEMDFHNFRGNGKWMQVDAKEMYYGWLRGMNTAYLFSPVEKVRYQTMDSPQQDGDRKNGVRCAVGGIRMEPKAVNSFDAELLKKIAERPQYNFLEQMIAHKVYSDRLSEYQANRKRISDIRITDIGRKTFIRCRIDGEMQLRQQLPESLQKVLRQADNKDATLVVLAEKTFQQQLAAPKQDCTIKR